MPPTLTDNEKRILLEQRLKAFAIDAYGHELNRQVAVATDDIEAVTAADTALEQIAVATATYEQELAVLGPAPALEEPVSGGPAVL